MAVNPDSKKVGTLRCLAASDDHQRPASSVIPSCSGKRICPGRWEETQSLHIKTRGRAAGSGTRLEATGGPGTKTLLPIRNRHNLPQTGPCATSYSSQCPGKMLWTRPANVRGLGTWSWQLNQNKMARSQGLAQWRLVAVAS